MYFSRSRSAKVRANLALAISLSFLLFCTSTSWRAASALASACLYLISCSARLRLSLSASKRTTSSPFLTRVPSGTMEINRICSTSTSHLTVIVLELSSSPFSETVMSRSPRVTVPRTSPLPASLGHSHARPPQPRAATAARTRAALTRKPVQRTRPARRWEPPLTDGRDAVLFIGKEGSNGARESGWVEFIGRVWVGFIGRDTSGIDPAVLPYPGAAGQGRVS